MEKLSLGVITGLHPTPGEALANVRRLGIPTVQVQYPQALDSEAGVLQIEAALRETGIEITAVFCGYEGESYADIPTIQKTVGLVPDATREERLARTERISRFAARLGVDHVAAHLGFIPHDTSTTYLDVVASVRGVCDALAARNQVFALETGQETASALKQFILDVNKPNLRVNFDPANMILYGNDNPTEALPLLSPYIVSVHCKDGRWPTQAGTLGEETPLGEGDVDFGPWLRALLASGFCGPLTIEREISGEEQERDILRARMLIEEMLAANAQSESQAQ